MWLSDKDSFWAATDTKNAYCKKLPYVWIVSRVDDAVQKAIA